MANDHSGPPAEVGARLRRRRKALHLTLKEVAERTGLTEGYLSQVERDQANASVRTLQRLCEVLKLTVGDLFDQAGSAAGPVLRFRDTHGMSFGKGATKIKLTPGPSTISKSSSVTSRPVAPRASSRTRTAARRSCCSS